MKAIENDGYLYDPPSWKVCDRCNGTGTEVEVVRDWPHGVKELWACSKCADSPRPGYLPIRYTPKEWKAAGGILTDDMPCWQIIKQGSEILRFMEPWGDLEQLREGEIYIATSAGPPEEERK